MNEIAFPVRQRMFLILLCAFVLLSSGSLCAVPAPNVKWIRAGGNTNALVWGAEEGLRFALHPGGFTRGEGGPRGLIRLGYPTLPDGRYDLINFIAVEPVVKGRKGYSELEKSAVDHKPGKLFWTGLEKPAEAPVADPGSITFPESGVEQLNLVVFVERFENGAHVRLKLAQRSDRTDELSLTIEAEADSAPIDSCILTATMGNKARARLLFLADGPVSSLQLYPEYRADHFSPHRVFGLARLPRARNGDVLVAIANDEDEPAKASPFGRPHFWDYKGSKVTQYWRKLESEITPELACAVNGRFVYWGGKQPIPGGIAFENFELRQPFKSGQTFIFGITRDLPGALNEKGSSSVR